MCEAEILHMTSHLSELLCARKSEPLDREELRMASEKLQRGGVIPPDKLMDLIQNCYQVLSSEPQFRDKESVYFFVSAILSSTEVDDCNFEGSVHWTELVSFAESFGLTYWEDT